MNAHFPREVFGLFPLSGVINFLILAVAFYWPWRLLLGLAVHGTSEIREAGAMVGSLGIGISIPEAGLVGSDQLVAFLLQLCSGLSDTCRLCCVVERGWARTAQTQ